MKATFKEIIESLGRQEKAFASLYRQMAKNFGLSECSMWILYFLLVADGQVSQQDLVEKMFFPKQTIHSAVKRLEEQSYLTLTKIPNTKNRKKLVLTREGQRLAEDTVQKMLQAELAAMEKMGQDKMAQYAQLQDEFYGLIEDSYKETGILEEKSDDSRR